MRGEPKDVRQQLKLEYELIPSLRMKLDRPETTNLALFQTTFPEVSISYFQNMVSDEGCILFFAMNFSHLRKWENMVQFEG